MGGTWSDLDPEPQPDPWWPPRHSHSPDHETQEVDEECEGVDSPERGARGRVRQEELESFKQELARKRALRHEALATLQAELRDLRSSVEAERSLRLRAEQERDALRSCDNELGAGQQQDTLRRCDEKELQNSLEAEQSLRLRAEQERDEPRSCDHVVMRSCIEVGAEQKQDTLQSCDERELQSSLEAETSLRLRAEEEGDAHDPEELRRELQREREEKARLMEELEAKAELEKQVQALKDVSEIGKEMLRIRELQVKELKKKLVEINLSSVMAPPEDLRVEYEKQIDNIRKLRTLYEERAAATLLEHRREVERNEAKIEVLETKLSQLHREAEEVKETKDLLESKVENLENTIQHKEDELETTKDSLFSSVIQNKSLNSQMTLINNLFSQMLVSPKVDLDRLTRLLKDNHGLIRDMTESGDENEVAALLVDLAGQVEKEQTEEKLDDLSPNVDENNEVQAVIALNLSKVWRVMVELLSHHQSPSHSEMAGGAESCYKCVETPAGPRSVISVSQTFLTLKDLILEKNRLVKEVGRLKTLNNHLEHRLGSQEKRLSVVTTELRKTWGIVNKLRAQHKQLHTHEKILRYELQQKRCMLTELKDELEHCKEKWDRARQKNNQTEEDWRNLRKEFAARKLRKESYSAESGYEEEDVVHSPTTDPNLGIDLVTLSSNNGSEPELSEEEIEHSDGNSFDTVIDLMDIIGLENQNEGEVESVIVLSEVVSDTSQVPPRLLPLSTSEFTQGLDQIESEDLAAILDTQYQNQLLGADYNLSLPSSSGSSPIPTENDDFASSEMDVSEEDSSSHDNHIYSSPFPITNQTVAENSLLFGSNSAQNISKFLDGLFAEQQNGNSVFLPLSLTLNVPSTSLSHDDDSATPLVSTDNSYQFPAENSTPLVVNVNCWEIPVQGLKKETKPNDLQHVQQWVIESQATSSDNSNDQENACCSPITTSTLQTMSTQCSASKEKTQEEILDAREDKLRILEKHCRSLVSTVMSNSFRSEIISSKLDELHLSYGSSEDASDIDEESLFKDKDNKHASQECQDTKQHPMSSQESSVPMNGETSNSHEIQPASSNNQWRTEEGIFEAKVATLKRLDDQCASDYSATLSISDTTSTKLDDLHLTSSYLSKECDSHRPSEPEPSTSHTCLAMTRLLANESVVNNHPKNDTDHTISELPTTSSESKDDCKSCSTQSLLNEPIKTIDIKKNRTPEEILEARAERFKRLEEQCKSLVTKMTATSRRSEIISNKLDMLHSCHGSSEDASDSEEHSTSRTGCRRRSTPSSSPRYNRKIMRPVTDKPTDETAAQDVTCLEENTERVAIPEVVSGTTESSPQTMADYTDRTKRTPEEILQARAQRLDRLEEQCKSLFSKMSATSNRSDRLSNRLQELHGQYGQPAEQQQATEEDTPAPGEEDCAMKRPQETDLMQSTSTNSFSEPKPPTVYDKRPPNLDDEKNSD